MAALLITQLGFSTVIKVQGTNGQNWVVAISRSISPFDPWDDRIPGKGDSQFDWGYDPGQHFAHFLLEGVYQGTFPFYIRELVDAPPGTSPPKPVPGPAPYPPDSMTITAITRGWIGDKADLNLFPCLKNYLPIKKTGDVWAGVQFRLADGTESGELHIKSELELWTYLTSHRFDHKAICPNSPAKNPTPPTVPPPPLSPIEQERADRQAADAAEIASVYSTIDVTAAALTGMINSLSTSVYSTINATAAALTGMINSLSTRVDTLVVSVWNMGFDIDDIVAAAQEESAAWRKAYDSIWDQMTDWLTTRIISIMLSGFDLELQAWNPKYGGKKK